ncbi:5'/3'-nucleotidase SurE [Dethiosulfatarculus sandiegensis]|nr:5'/3'-nucleotidase SurE [Dethiosulfatarculus sandiegensis]
MRILLTNDDGVMAPGLAALHDALSREHDVFVVAPEREQSAVGHAITLADPLLVHKLSPKAGFNGYAVSGTPADCVKLALHELMPEPPDLVASGINVGANLGFNLLYSGTVSAANEASLQGIKAMAISLGTRQDPDFSYAARFAAHLVKNWDILGPYSQTPLNVNVPALAPDKIKGVRFVRQSQARLTERFVPRTDPWGRTYYWQAGETMGKDGGLDADFPALMAGYVTITPMAHDFTNNEALDLLRTTSLDLPQP